MRKVVFFCKYRIAETASNRVIVIGRNHLHSFSVAPNFFLERQESTRLRLWKFAVKVLPSLQSFTKVLQSFTKVCCESFTKRAVKVLPSKLFNCFILVSHFCVALPGKLAFKFWFLNQKHRCVSDKSASNSSHNQGQSDPGKSTSHPFQFGHSLNGEGERVIASIGRCWRIAFANGRLWWPTITIVTEESTLFYRCSSDF